MVKRVLFLSYLGGLGGGETFLLNHLKALDRSRFDPIVLVASTGALVERLQALDIPVITLEFRNREGLAGRLHGMDLIKRLLKIIQQQKIELLHLNDIELGKYGAIAARLAAIPVLWTCHGWWYAGRLRELFYRSMIDRIVMVSTMVRERLTERRIIPPSMASVIHPGIDVADYRLRPLDHSLKAEWDLGTDNLVIAIIGRFQPIKGHTNFLAAARLVYCSVPEARFLIVGGNVFGSSEDATHQARILAEVEADPELRSRVRFVGFQPDITKVLSVVDVLVSASEAETFGMVHIEAMACERVVVSTDRGGPRDIVREGETGFLVPPSDPEALANRIVQLCREPRLRQRLGAAGRKRVEELFNTKHQVRRYEALYDELLGIRP
ncbi:putative glycosyltransferase EpsD [compost metagenome]